MKLWLASGRPRRKQLLSWSGFECDVHPKNIDESVGASEDPMTYVLRMAKEKSEGCPAQRVVLSADTIVHAEGRIYGKPTDREDAVRILNALAGTTHTVTTSVCLRYRGDVRLFACDTKVRLRKLSEREIQRYVDSGEADDKAGAYGIQGSAGAFVAEVHGSWTNVMGLPVEAVLDALEAMGIHAA